MTENCVIMTLGRAGGDRVAVRRTAAADLAVGV